MLPRVCDLEKYVLKALQLGSAHFYTALELAWKTLSKTASDYNEYEAKHRLLALPRLAYA